MSSLREVCPQGYRKHIYYISHILSILSILSDLSSTLQDMAISYSIYQPVGVSYGLDTRLAGVGIGPETTWYLPGGDSYKQDNRMSESILRQSILPPYPILPIRYPTG